MVLFALLLYVVAEIVAFVVVAEHIGILLAIILLLGISAAGPLLVRRAGTGVLEHARRRIQRGETPDREVLDGVVLLLGGVFVCVPGFIGDVLGLLLLIAPVRHAAIRLAGRQLGRRVAAASVMSFMPPGFGGRSGGGRSGGGRFGGGASGGRVVDVPTHSRADTDGYQEPAGLPSEPDEPPPS